MLVSCCRGAQSVYRWSSFVFVIAVIVQLTLKTQLGTKGYYFASLFLLFLTGTLYCPSLFGCYKDSGLEEKHEQQQETIESKYQEATKRATSSTSAANDVSHSNNEYKSNNEGDDLEEVNLHSNMDNKDKAVVNTSDVEKQSSQADTTGIEHDEHNDSAVNQQQQQQQPQQQGDQTPAGRLYFLDSVKIFLTAVVVSHHVGCAIGGCRESWILSFGAETDNDDDGHDAGPRWSNFLVRDLFITVNQAYFMPLFFFISAFFTPSSYDRKGHATFLRDKAKRLWIPATITALTSNPLALIIAQVTVGAPIRYAPLISHLWFVFWLLIFNFVYAVARRKAAASSAPPSLEERIDADVDDNNNKSNNNSVVVIIEPTMTFPSSIRRFLYGFVVCGLVMGAFALLMRGPFFGMPISIGSFVCDVLFFTAGLTAKRNGWLLTTTKTIGQQLGMRFECLLILVLLEIVAIVALRIVAANDNNNAAILALLIVAGVFCVDMSLVVLHFFQTYGNFTGMITRFLADAAYTVYLIHPLMVTVSTTVYVQVYNSIYGDVIQFDDNDRFSNSRLEGPDEGGLHLIIAFLILNVVCHGITWPMAWMISKLPILNQYL